METIHTNAYEKNCQDITETVYDSLCGQLIPEYHLPWVEDIFVPGHPCYENYAQMRRAYEHLLERLNEVDEDQDAENMINHLMAYGRIIAMEMFKYGRKYQQMLDAQAK